jgi:cytochrome c oxidase cbb3-type subunit 3
LIWFTLLVGGAPAFAGASCGRAPDTREWKAEDHDRADDNMKGRAAPARVDPSANPSADPMVTLVEVTWRNQCAPCHGPVGRGDGPQGQLVHAPDLTKADWQSKATDVDIARVIVKGKNRMPKFELPPDVVAGLVARIRATKGR